jgi:glycosyltransferase involved in cell wall biosynthesis
MSITRPPIDTGIYRPIPHAQACLQAGLGAERRYFIFVGRLDDTIKRVSAIIGAFSHIAKDYPNIDLLIAGSGPDEETLQNQALVQAPGRVRFWGWVAKDEEKAWLLNSADCLIMASKREGFPTVIGEAFACGLPVISSDVGTIADLVIEGKTGWLFAAGDDQALTRCMLWVAQHPAEVKSMKMPIRQWAEETVSVGAIAQTLKKGFSSI